MLISRSRERGISPWVSLRMNDMHYHDDPYRMNPFWNDNPQFWILKKPGSNNGLDFTQAEVRAHCLDVASLCRGYNDVEVGLEGGKPQQIVWVEMVVDPRAVDQSADR